MKNIVCFLGTDLEIKLNLLSFSIQICEDINECQQSPNGGCSDLRECENTMGSFQCGPCPPGYVEDGDFNCRFSDPCAAGVHNCQKTEYCNNHAVGEFHCFVSRIS